VVLCLAGAASDAHADATGSARRHALSLAVRGVRESGAWWAPGRHWYYEGRQHSGSHPLATLWGVLPLFEALDALAIADPTRTRRAAVARFARGAERYWNAALRPVPGYAAYPGEHGRRARTWFDDNGWWGLAFLDAYRATGDRRYVRDAARAFDFLDRAGWDRRRGGIWWNTDHSFKAGESLASGTLLAARLFRRTGRSRYLRAAKRYIGWGNRHAWNARDGLYARSDRDPVSLAYVQGPMIAAESALCPTARVWCARAERLATRALRRFTTSLDMGPQFDAVYLRWMLALYERDHDPRWYWLVRENADRAERNACDRRPRCTRAWDGSTRIPQTRPGMLQTHAATISVFAWLATAEPPPSPPPAGLSATPRSNTSATARVSLAHP
jgi:glycosyl hydrolase family 76